ncbi:MAG TPA: hypothetical protein PLM25_04080 [Limnochordia bacterium]|nr:hypothetical protein [Limnochordia bacterium]
MSRTSALQLVRELYGTQRREGLDKYSVEHPLDVVQYCFLHLEPDNLRVMRMLNVALLHDVVEDYLEEGYTLEKVQSVVGLQPKETMLLGLLTRKQGQEEDYLPELFSVEEAARIKLADRIANCRDLLSWVRQAQGFPARARRIYEKYRKENELIFRLVHEHYGRQLDDPAHPISQQVQLLQEVAAELEQLYTQYVGS